MKFFILSLFIVYWDQNAQILLPNKSVLLAISEITYAHKVKEGK